MVSLMVILFITKCFLFVYMYKDLLTLSQTIILDFSKLKEFADDKFKFDENGGKFSDWLENTVGKGEIALNKQFLLFPQYFQKTCTADM